MEEQTTTAPDEQETGAPAAQPDEQVNDAAATQPNEPAANEPSSDENLAWLQKKGIDPTSPEALGKVAEMYRNAEKAMHQSASKASELEKAVQGAAQQYEPANPSQIEELAARLQRVELESKINNFFAENPSAKELESKMTEIVVERPEIGQLVNQGYLSLADLHSLALTGDTTRDEKLKQDGGREALEKVASKQQAKANPGVATNSALSEGTVTKANFDDWYSGLSAAERAKPENQAIVNRLLSQ